MKKGFSFGEMLATMIIIGIISAITIPIMVQSSKTRIRPAYKAAFLNVQSIVNELINDVSVYPSGELSNDTFCGNFFSKVNTINFTENNCDNDIFDSTLSPDNPTGITTNGMKWYNIEDDFLGSQCPSGTTSGECIKIRVDVDGNKGENKITGSDKDILDIYVFKSGKIGVEPNSTEEEHLLN